MSFGNNQQERVRNCDVDLGEQTSIEELIDLCALDNDLYGRTFFPKTVRQASPPFHKDMDRLLDGPDRYVAFMIFRDGAKTTKIRLFISKRISYGMARTIVIVGKSQDHAIKSVSWLKKNIEYNPFWAQTFGLKKGSKWADAEIEILHGVEEISITILALGITGSTRGINIDDYRPDLILVDDPSDEENTATPEQREKTDDFINGSLRNSLAPESEAPWAKMVFAQTLLNKNDSISKCAADPLWAFLKIPCFTPDGESAWPARYPKEQLLEEKQSFIARGKLYLWMREKECVIASKEQSSFQIPLQFYDMLPDPIEQPLTYYMGIDPVPPPSEKELQNGLKGKDWEVFAIVGVRGRAVFLAEYVMNHGHNPDWSVAQFFRLKAKYSPIKARVESVAYQRTLKWLIERAMTVRGEWMQIDDTSSDGNRAKIYRIIDSVGSVTGDRRLFVHRSQTEFVEQYELFPNVDHDDVIDAVSMAIRGIPGMVSSGVSFESIVEQDRELPMLGYIGGCP